MLNEKLKNLRDKKGYKQKEIAKLLNITVPCYSNYEQGRREPDIETLKKICAVYDISLDELLDFDLERYKKNIIITNSFNNSTFTNNGTIKF